MFKENNGIGPIPNSITIFVLIVIVAVGTLFFYFSGKGGEPSRGVKYRTYTNKDYGFSFSYPSNWTLDNREMLGRHMVLLRENVSENRPNAQIRISAGGLGISSLDNVRDQITSNIENNENATLTNGPTDIELQDVPGLSFTLRLTNPQGNFRAREVLFNRENMDCTIFFVVVENSYEDFKPDIEHIFESFNFLELGPSFGLENVEKTKVEIKTEAVSGIIKYREESFYSENDFAIISKNENKFSSQLIQNFKEEIIGVTAENCEVNLDQSRKSTVLNCDIIGATCDTNRYSMHFLLKNWSFDLYQFEEHEKKLVYEGKIDGVQTKIVFEFPYELSHCHEHVWPT